MNKEHYFLQTIQNITKSQYLGDDCAYLDEYDIAISQDCLVEDVHFSLSYMNAQEIAKKALLVNISDILAFGALPQFYSISLSGNLNEEFIKEFYLGLNSISNEYNLKLTGGDLTKSDKITISIAIIGNCKNRNLSSRKNAKPNYVVAVAGEFGSSAQGLYELQNGLRESYFIEKHKFPILNPKLSSNIALNTKYPYAMMDSSDGLSDCLFQIAKKSNVRIDIDYSLIPHKTQNRDFVLHGGEDYSLVACMEQSDFIKFPELKKIGEVQEGEGIFIDNERLDVKSYEHFN